MALRGTSKAGMRQPKRGRCPACHKLGLNVPSLTHSGQRWRDCRYCGASVRLDEPKPTPKETAP